jgi:two-component system, LytTR family, response regulator
MKKLKTIIAEDSPPFLDLIEKVLNTYCPSVEILAKEITLDGAFESILKYEPNLVFLDIDFGGPTSFEILKKLKDLNKINFQVVFLTAYTEKEHYINAFKYSALQYLNKPIDHDLLIETVNRALEYVKDEVENQMDDQLNVMFDAIETNDFIDNSIMLKQIKKNYEKVELNEIVYLKSDESMTIVKLQSGRIIKTVDLIGSYSYLMANRLFFRISQSAFINKLHIKTYNVLTKQLEMNQGAILTVSRQRDKEFKKFLNLEK